MSPNQPSTPTIKLTFHGLLAVCHNRLNENNHCEVGILSEVPEHELTIKVFKTPIQQGVPAPQEEIFSDVFSHPFIRLFETIELNVTNPLIPGVSFRKAEAISDDAFDRFVTEKQDTSPQDFRWVVDLEGKEFHEKPLPANQGQLKPIIIIKHGEFYTAAKTERQVQRTKAGVTEDFGRVAAKIGVDISLSPGGEVYLKAGNGGNGPVEWKFPLEPGATYEVTIENICPIDPNAAPTELKSDHKFFDEAFNVPEGERIDLTIPPPPPPDPTAPQPAGPSAIDNLCEGTFLSQTQTFLS